MALLLGVVWAVHKDGVVRMAIQQPKHKQQEEQGLLPSSALAVATAVRTSSSGRLNFSTRFGGGQGLKMQPSLELLTLCSHLVEESDRKLQHSLNLTMYVRTPECYGTDELELRQVRFQQQPGDDLLLLFTSDVKPSLQDAETFLAERGAVELPDFNALVLPLAKELCLVGILVAERIAEIELTHVIDDEGSVIDVQHPTRAVHFTMEETRELLKLAQSLTMACVMDQRVALLHHASWQKSVKIDKLLEQARGSLTAVRTLAKLLLPHLKRGEISYDVLEDILVQGDRMKAAVEEIQEALYLATPMGHQGNQSGGEGWTPPDPTLKLGTATSGVNSNMWRDTEAPMPPLTLASPDGYASTCFCIVAEVLSQLVQVGAKMAARKGVELDFKVEPLAESVAAAVEESALRQAVSKLLDNAMLRATPGPGGWIKVRVCKAPGGGVLLVIEDNGADMSMVMQARAMGPLGPMAAIKSVELGLDLKVARDLLECFGVVIRITSPFDRPAAAGGGGMRVELWLPQAAGATAELVSEGGGTA